MVARTISEIDHRRRTNQEQEMDELATAQVTPGISTLFRVGLFKIENA